MQQRLFADDLRADLALGLIGHHVVREVFRPLRQIGDDPFCLNTGMISGDEDFTLTRGQQSVQQL